MGVADEIRRIARQPQSQASLRVQINLLHDAAVRLGLYDADEWLFRCLPAAAAPERETP